MTVQEALQEIRKQVFRDTEDFSMRISKECYKTIVNILEKEISKKPLNIEVCYDGDYGNCPNCNAVVADYANFKRCKHCGQVLEWGNGNA